MCSPYSTANCCSCGNGHSCPFRSSVARLALLATSRSSLPSLTPAPQTKHFGTCGAGALARVSRSLEIAIGMGCSRPNFPALTLYTFLMPRSIAREQDILGRPSPKRPPRLTSRRIGIHISTAGGIHNAAERAYRLGCNTLQIFSTSPRQWAPYELSNPLCEQMLQLRAQYNLKPLVIHTNYLVNLGSTNELFLKKSIEAFRREIERALAICADYLVLHPGSFRGADREAGLLQTAAAIAAATQGLDLAQGGLAILIENTAGSEFSLGGSFEQVAEVIDRLRGIVPIAAC